MRVIMNLDFENFVNPSSDEAGKILADLLSHHGIRGCFMTVAEKARALRSRGRHDIINIVKNHEVNYHSDLHSGKVKRHSVQVLIARRFDIEEVLVRRKSVIIEWNAHIFSPDLQNYPFHRNAAYRPDVSKMPADPLGAYLQRMEQEGMNRAVLVHPEPYGDDHRLILECLERERERLRGTCLFYPKAPDAPRKMEELVALEPNIIAVRIHAHRGKEMYLDSFTSTEVRLLWEKALQLGLVIELHIGPDYAKQVSEMLRDYPESKVLIDHLAEPHMGNAVEYADVLSLADFDHVYMKLSGLNHFAKDAPLYLSARPFTRIVIETFSPDRLVWGSGTPEIVGAHMEGYTETDRMKAKGDNLAKLLGFA